jgi:opacity protein-like surface antigen
MKRKIMILLLAAASLSARNAAADSSIGFRAIGGALSYVDPENLNGTIGFGVFADLGRISPQVALEPRLDFWSQSQEELGAKASVRDITLGARAKYFFKTSSTKVHPFAGGGLGFHFVRAEASVTEPGFTPMSVSQSDTKLGIDMGGGISTGLSPKVDLNAELWYGIVSDIDQLSLRMGIAHKFN